MWDKIAKTGTYVDMYGNTHTFTAKDFNEIVSNYKISQEKAPIVIGHPKTDSPAFGWIADLRTNGDYLEARYENISPKIKEAVDNGSYKYKSISLFTDLKKIKHIGLLGAVPPAISGLGEISFSDNKSEITLYFSQFNKEGEKIMKEPLLEKISELERELLDSKQELLELKHQLEVLKKQADESLSAKEQAEAKVAEVTNSFSAYVREEKVNSLIKAGKLEPAKKDEVLKVIEKLSDKDAAFASHDKNELIESYLQSISKDIGLFGGLSAPVKQDSSSCNLNDIIGKL